jgi:hypothetical protein
MRPRKYDTGLPKGVYLKHGAYYRVIKNQWIRLGTHPACVHWPPHSLPIHLSGYKEEILAYAYRVLTRARQNAKGRGGGIAFNLTKECVHRMLNESGWRCAVTGADFSMELVNGTRPFAPSIDRRDCSEGYTPGNCRMVCVAANFAMNVWGEAVLWRLFDKRKQAGLLDAARRLDGLPSK